MQQPFIGKHGKAAFLRIVVFAAGCAAFLSANSIVEAMDAEQAVVAVKPTIPADDSGFFDSQVRPIFAANCFKCHGTDTHKAELNLSSAEGILKGGESGKIIEPGNPEKSKLFEVVHDGEMPPDGNEPLTAEQIEAIRRWIQSGAKFKTDAASAQSITQQDVLPMLTLRCTVCHGLRRREAGLDLRTKASMLKGGKSGPAFVPGKPDDSLILKRVRSGEMPPTREVSTVSVKPIEPQEVELLANWILQGTPEVAVMPDVATSEPDTLVNDEDRKFWAFQPPRAATVPIVQAAERVRNPIDAYILQKLEAQKLSLSTEADRRTLIRRATFDLIGLPPTPDEVNQFIRDPDPLAYESLIDRLLASPHYGERWSRMWLDLAGYADSEGIQHADMIRPDAYRYRDYVIRSLNSDKPYDRFLLEQIAGDELADYEHAKVITEELADNLIATGFLRMSPDATYAYITGFVPDRLKVVDDEMEILGSAVMGLTLKCARCHSHKFDPLPHRDYYRLTAIFKGAYDEHDWLVSQRQAGAVGTKDRLLPFVATEEREAWQQHESQLNSRIEAAKSALNAKTAEFTARLVEKRIAELSAQLHDDLKRMLATPSDKRDAVQKYLGEKFESRLRVSPDELRKLDAEYARLAENAEAEIKQFEGQKQPEPLIRALWDRGEPSPTYILQRGDYLKPARLVGPGVPSVLTDGKTPFVVEPPWPGATKTGRRLAFAKWLTRTDNPLTARVIVNRIWKHHFGNGIVKSLDNFGKVGAKPTHPELLDWLAVDFVKNGWSLKNLHRLMMTSQTYRQSSQVTTDHEQRDPENQLLSRMNLRRLEAEMLRDAILDVSGCLDHRPFGTPEQVTARDDGLVTSVGTERGWRRSIYVLQRRTQVPTILSDFDLPPMSPNCIERTESIVSPQALHLMNNGTVHELAGRFAERVRIDAGTDVDQQVARIYDLALGRPPSDDELSAARNAIANLAKLWQAKAAASTAKPGEAMIDPQPRSLANFCHAILNSAEFLYVD